MRTVFKYPIESHEFIIELPRAAKVVKAQTAHTSPTDIAAFFWMELDPDTKEKFAREFKVVGTGHPVPEGFSYCDTFFMGPLVWHLYEKEMALLIYGN